MVFRVVMALGLIAGAAGPAAAEDMLARDPSCTPQVTVRHQDCTATTYSLCPRPDGEVYRSEQFQNGQATLVGYYDADYNMIAGGLADGSVRIEAQETSETVRLSMDQLKRDGRASYVEVLRMDAGGTVIEMTTRNEAVLKPEPVVIDGMVFQMVNLNIRTETKPDLGRITSNVRLYLSDALPLPLEGRTATSANGGTQITATDPVEIILPGEPDFGTTQARPGCGPMNG